MRKGHPCFDCGGKIDLKITKRCSSCYAKYRTGKPRDYLTIAARQGMRAAKLGENNPQWKGDAVGYGSLHEWVKNRMPLPKVCVTCGSTKHIDLANKGTYDRNLENWKWQCRKCHLSEDGRIAQSIMLFNVFNEQWK